MEFSPARQRFYQEVQQPEEQIDLAAAALYIAQENYPDLEVEAYLNALDTMAVEVRERLPEEPYPLKIIRTLNQYLFTDLGFKGNTDDYYDPRNSFLNEVIERRTGIPISLSLVYLEVARRVDFPMAGVGLPGHFLIRPTLEEMAIFVDPFHDGEILFEADCRDRLQSIYGEGAKLLPEHLEAIGSKALLARLLSNLKIIYLHHRDLIKALGTMDRILLMFPNAAPELRDRGLIYYQQGRLTEARYDLELYLYERPDAADAFEVRQVIEQIERVKDG
ncbi:MAG: tetratricopeptide repeat protein [Cyanobacteria bacterium Co-bin13]|nr:tetratricopeptide repeat protein [Cyanobacteria bacterium Co-bin13]